MYRAKCKCGGHVDFKRTKIKNVHYCPKCKELLIATYEGIIYTFNSARLTGYFKVGNLKKENDKIVEIIQ